MLKLAANLWALHTVIGYIMLGIGLIIYIAIVIMLIIKGGMKK